MMTFTTTPPPLLNALQQASAMRVNIMRFRAEPGWLRLRAFDRLVPAWCDVSVPVQVDQPGEAYFYTEPLIRALSVFSSSSEDMHFRHDAKKNSLNFSIEGSTFSLYAPDSETFPSPPDMPECPDKLYQRPEGLMEALNSTTVIAESKKADSRCRHVLFHPDHKTGKLVLAATDTVMSGMCPLPGAASAFKEGVALKSHAARLALRIFHGETEVDIACHDSTVFFRGLYGSLAATISDEGQTMLGANIPGSLIRYKTDFGEFGRCAVKNEQEGMDLKTGLLLASMSGSDRVRLLSNKKGLVMKTRSDTGASSVAVAGETASGGKDLDVILHCKHLEIALDGLGESEQATDITAYSNKKQFPIVVSVLASDVESEFWIAPSLVNKHGGGGTQAAA